MSHRQLPGDISESEHIAQMIRVNQAGEYGASRIYAGQLAALSNSSAIRTIHHMYTQELEHLQTFNTMMQQRRVRPTVLSPLWHGLGYALGYVTGKMGVKAAMACTVAVEDVIDKHYYEQEVALQQWPQEHELKSTIQRFRQEELEHRDIGLEHKAETLLGYKFLKASIRLASQTAIWLSKRI